MRAFSSLLVAVALLALPSAALGRPAAANPKINVSYSLNGTISVALPDGTQVGATSGSPTVISGGWYDFEMLGPGGCASIPQFILKGPGTYLADNLDGGETQFLEHPAVHLLPNSTYTWTNDAFPSVVHTFQTNSTSLGAAPDPNAKDGLTSSKHTTVTSSDFVGSNVFLPRGTIRAAVTAGGKLTFTYKGKPVTTLKRGEYKITVNDTSKSSGFLLQKRTSKRVTTVTSAVFVGKRTKTVLLSNGKWYFMPRAGQQTTMITVVSPV